MKIAFILIAVLLVLVLAGGLLVGDYFYSLALTPGSDKSDVLGAEHNQMEPGESNIEIPEVSDEQWFLSAAPKDVYQTSEDGLTLHAYALEQAQDNRWAIVCHGYTSRAGQMKYIARHFYEQGYNVLMPDARGHGQSEGDYIGMGWDDRLDVVGWIRTIVQNDPAAQIVLYGVSMGGATVMMVSGEALPDNVKVIVEDCGYSSIKDEFSYQLKQLFGVPSFPFMEFASVVTKMRAGFFLEEGSAVKQVAKSQTPMLFIHGAEDTFVPASMVQEVYDAAAVEKDLLVVEGAGHGQSATVLGPAYWDTVDAFIGRFVRGS
jgi:fermentation-respiration switch protein FrsA (DUF1100 family)